MKKLVPVFALAVALTATARAQNDAGSEEIIVLSPFCVTASDDAYRSSDALAGARVATPLIDPSSANRPPGVPITIFKRAESVAIQFVLSHAGDRQEVRNRELYESVAALQAGAAASSGLRLEQREVRFAGGNRTLFSATRGSAMVSFATVVIFADLTPEMRIVDRVKQVRDLIQSTKLVGATKAADGSVGLYLAHPESYRAEILKKIFADLAVLREGLGAEFEIQPSGLAGRVQSRVASETEIELWIDYSFAIQSVRELTRPTKG